MCMCCCGDCFNILSGVLAIKLLLTCLPKLQGLDGVLGHRIKFSGLLGPAGPECSCAALIPQCM